MEVTINLYLTHLFWVFFLIVETARLGSYKNIILLVVHLLRLVYRLLHLFSSNSWFWLSDGSCKSGYTPFQVLKVQSLMVTALFGL